MARSDLILKQGSTPGKTNKSADSKPFLLVLVEWLNTHGKNRSGKSRCGFESRRLFKHQRFVFLFGINIESYISVKRNVSN